MEKRSRGNESVESCGLQDNKCKPCEGVGQALDSERVVVLLEQVSPEWKVLQGHRLSRRFAFPDFKKALEFTNAVGLVAEQEGHHPNISLTWGEVIVDIWTHAIDGLSENDFILAAKIDGIST